MHEYLSFAKDVTSPITVKYLDPDDNAEKQTLLGTIFVQKDGFAYFQFAAGINDTLAKVGDITIDECMIECRLNSSAVGDTERISLEVGGLTIEIGVGRKSETVAPDYLEEGRV